MGASYKSYDVSLPPLPKRRGNGRQRAAMGHEAADKSLILKCFSLPHSFCLKIRKPLKLKRFPLPGSLRERGALTPPSLT